MIRRLLITAVVFVAGITMAQAHAFLDSAEPAVGATIRQSPGVVKIWFTRELKIAGSDLEVLNARGAEVDLKASTVDSKNRFLVSVAVPTLPPGIYKVVWNAVCLGDGHHTTGSYTFEVAN